MKNLMRIACLAVVGLMLSQNAFAVFSEGRVGPSLLQDGSVKELRLGRDGASMVQDSHSKYQEQVLRGNSFYCANLAGTAVTTQAGLSATTPALTLYNPANSGKNLVLTETGLDVTAAPAAAAGFMIAVSSAIALSGGSANGAITLATVATVLNANTASQTQSSGQCYRVATLPFAPVAMRYIGGTTGAAAISGVVLTDPTDGKIVVGPGTAISIQSTSAAAIIAHFLWEEVPL